MAVIVGGSTVGTDMYLSWLASAKAESSILLISCDKTRVSMFEHAKNAPGAIFVTLEGMVMLPFNFMQSEKAK